MYVLITLVYKHRNRLKAVIILDLEIQSLALIIEHRDYLAARVKVDTNHCEGGVDIAGVAALTGTPVGAALVHHNLAPNQLGRAGKNFPILAFLLLAVGTVLDVHQREQLYNGYFPPTFGLICCKLEDFSSGREILLEELCTPKKQRA